MDDDALPRRAPEEQGVASSGLLALVDALEAVDEVHSLMVVTRGAVVAEGWWDPYTPERPHQLFSLTKTFTAIAVGFAEAEGLLSPEDLLLDHMTLDGAAPHPNLEQMRLSHLLTMTTGHHEDTSDRVFEQEDWVQAFLRLPVEHEPGTHFVYNTAATHVLSAVVQQVTGERVIDYLAPRLLEPLGIRGATTEQSPTGVDTGGFGMSARTEDLARLGVLLLDDGMWRGRRVLPEGWVAAASRAHTPSTGENPDWRQGYGYQMWRGRHGTFRGDGAFGQFCVVLPEQRTVVAITAGTQDMQGVLDALWAHLLPAVGDSPLPADADAHGRLAERLATLRHEPPLGRPPHAGAWRAGPEGGFGVVVDPNAFGVSALRVFVGDRHTFLTVATDGSARRPRTFLDGPGDARAGGSTVAGAYGTWQLDAVPIFWDLPGRRARGTERPEPVACAASVDDHGALRLTVRLLETPFVADVRLARDGEDVTVTGQVNVAFGATTAPPLRGWVRDGVLAERTRGADERAADGT